MGTGGALAMPAPIPCIVDERRACRRRGLLRRTRAIVKPQRMGRGVRSPGDQHSLDIDLFDVKLLVRLLDTKRKVCHFVGASSERDPILSIMDS